MPLGMGFKSDCGCCGDVCRQCPDGIRIAEWEVTIEPGDLGTSFGCDLSPFFGTFSMSLVYSDPGQCIYEYRHPGFGCPPLFDWWSDWWSELPGAYLALRLVLDGGRLIFRIVVTDGAGPGTTYQWLAWWYHLPDDPPADCQSSVSLRALEIFGAAPIVAMPDTYVVVTPVPA